MEFDIMDPWINLPPAHKEYSFTNCYGTIKIENNIYAMSELIEDNEFTTSQKSQYEYQSGLKNDNEMQAAGIEDDSRPRTEALKESTNSDQFMKITAA